MVEPKLTPPCPNCEQRPEPGANFCYHCGERLREPPPPPQPLPPEPDPPRRPPWAVIVAVVVVLGAAMAGWLAWRSAETGESPGPEPSESDVVSPAATVAPTQPTPEPSLIINDEGTTLLTVSVANCVACEVIAIPADGTAQQSATVSGGSVEFAMPTSSTVGMAFEIIHPEGFGATGPNMVVLRPETAEPGQQVGVQDIIDAQRLAICWSGTAAAVSSISLAADPYTNDSGVRLLRVWADPARATIGTPAPNNGTGGLNGNGLQECRQARAAVG